MADINNVTLVVSHRIPIVSYRINYTRSRPNNSQMTYNFTITAWLGTFDSFIRNGHALMCGITVNGVQRTVRIKANTNDNWEGTAPRVRNVSVNCASTSGNVNQSVRFQVWSDGEAQIIAGTIDNSAHTVLSLPMLVTAATAPTTASVSPTISEGNAVLSWSGAAGGLNNSITGYDIEFSDSTNNSAWGAWQFLGTVTSTATSVNAWVNPSATRGNFRRYRVRTRGSAGSSFFSGWRTSSNSVRRNTTPNAPTAVSASPVVYSDEVVTLAWSGASPGLSPIRGFQIASRTSTGEPVPPELNITQIFIPAGASNRPGRVNQMLYVTIHETDNTSVGANARGHAAWLNTPGTAVSWHYTVDDTETVQYLPENEDGFHAGDGAGNGNRNSIGIEICVNSDGDFTKAVQRAIELAADICNRRNIPITNVVQHQRWSGKHCPRNIREGRPFSWEVFLQNVAADTGADITWSGWTVLAILNRASTSGSYNPAVSRIPGTYTQFGVWTIDTLGAFSGESISNIIKNEIPDRPPLAPIVDAPRNNSVTYNRKPMVFIQVQPEPDGQLQTVFVRVGNGAWHNTVEHPQYFTSSGELSDNARTIYTADELPLGNHVIQVHTSDGGFDSPVVTRNITIATSPFDTITFNATAVKARHITDLRAVINNNRNYYNMTAFAWMDEIIPGETFVMYWPFHIMELRAAFGAVAEFVNGFDVPDIVPIVWQTIGTRRPRAAVMTQLNTLALQV